MILTFCRVGVHIYCTVFRYELTTLIAVILRAWVTIFCISCAEPTIPVKESAISES
jgi:hypothetical protein